MVGCPLGEASSTTHTARKKTKRVCVSESFLLDWLFVHIQQCEEAGEAQRCPVHVEQPHSEYTMKMNCMIFEHYCSNKEVVVFRCQSEHFSFLGVNNQSNLSDMRCRTTFYTALGRLLMVDLGKYFSRIAQTLHMKFSARCKTRVRRLCA